MYKNPFIDYDGRIFIPLSYSYVFDFATWENIGALSPHHQGYKKYQNSRLSAGWGLLDSYNGEKLIFY